MYTIRLVAIVKIHKCIVCAATRKHEGNAVLVCFMQDKHVDAFTDKVGGYLNSVVGLLLRHNKAEIRTLGARLLAQFEKVQVSFHFTLTSSST